MTVLMLISLMVSVCALLGQGLRYYSQYRMERLRLDEARKQRTEQLDREIALRSIRAQEQQAGISPPLDSSDTLLNAGAEFDRLTDPNSDAAHRLLLEGVKQQQLEDLGEQVRALKQQTADLKRQAQALAQARVTTTNRRLKLPPGVTSQQAADVLNGASQFLDYLYTYNLGDTYANGSDTIKRGLLEQWRRDTGRV